MIFVCAFYAIAWLPESVYFLLMGLNLNLTLLDSGYYAVLGIAFLYISTDLYHHYTLRASVSCIHICS